jgi:signal transduction histidine kinase/ActR/RegA family two-component response regulator
VSRKRQARRDATPATALTATAPAGAVDVEADPPQPGRRRPVRWTLGLGAAALGVGVGMGGRLLVQSWLGDEVPFVFAFPAVAVVAYLAGLWPALLAAVACAAWVLAPALPPSPPPATAQRQALLFLPSAASVALLSHWAATTLAVAPTPAAMAGPAPPVLRWLRAAIAVAALVPAVFLAALAWTSYGDAIANAQTRLDRAARIAREHASRVIETNEGITRHIVDLVGHDDDAAIRARESELHQRLRDITAGLPQIHSAWVWDRAGRPLASNLSYPVPMWLDVSDREYFQWHREGRGGWFVSGTLVSRTRGDRFFDVTYARIDRDSKFAGVVSVSLRPDYFTDFYAELAEAEPGLMLTLLRADGALIARHPNAIGPGQWLARDSALMPHLAAREVAGAGHSRSTSDGTESLFAFRKIDGYPLYVAAGLDRGRVLADWYREMALLGALTFPSALGLVFVSGVALRRARHELAALAALRAESESRDRAERALRQAQKLEAMGQLTGGVAHDFNNLLMIVGNNVHLLRRLHPDLAEDARLAAIARAVGSGEKLTRQLLAFSRRQALRPEVLRLQDVLPALADLIKPAVGSRVQVATRVAPDTAAVELDPAELELAVLNLALNARDAMPGGGQLTIDARNAAAATGAAQRVVLSVSDTGSGIPHELQERVFEPFFTTKPVGEGTGLGLSQVYGMCTQVGGTARIESRPGEGTTVRLSLPASTRSPEVPIADGGTQHERFDARVLLVEDNDEVAHVTADLLRSFGCAVERVRNGEAAVTRLDGAPHAFDIVLSDIVMPGYLDGLALADRLRSTHPNLPIVLMTGHSEQVRRADGADYEVLQKPFAPATLLSALLRATAARKTSVVS